MRFLFVLVSFIFPKNMLKYKRLYNEISLEEIWVNYLGLMA